MRDTQASVQLMSSHARHQQRGGETRGSERKALRSILLLPPTSSVTLGKPFNLLNVLVLICEMGMMTVMAG